MWATNSAFASGGMHHCFLCHGFVSFFLESALWSREKPCAHPRSRTCHSDTAKTNAGLHLAFLRKPKVLVWPHPRRLYFWAYDRKACRSRSTQNRPLQSGGVSLRRHDSAFPLSPLFHCPCDSHAPAIVLGPASFSGLHACHDLKCHPESLFLPRLMSPDTSSSYQHTSHVNIINNNHFIHIYNGDRVLVVAK